MKVFNNPHAQTVSLVKSKSSSLQNSRAETKENVDEGNFQDLITKYSPVVYDEPKFDIREEMNRLRSKVIGILKKYQVLLEKENAKTLKPQIRSDTQSVRELYEVIIENYSTEQAALEVEKGIPSIDEEKVIQKKYLEQLNSQFNLVEEFLEKFSSHKARLNYFSQLQSEKMSKSGLAQFCIQEEERNSAYDFELTELSYSGKSSEEEENLKIQLSNSQRMRGQIRRRFFDVALKLKESLPLYHQGRTILVSLLFEDAEEEAIDEKDWETWIMTQLQKVDVNHVPSAEKVHYTITIFNSENEQINKTTTQRYSELKEFHEQLIKSLNLLKLQIPLPEFPKKKLFGSTNKDKESIITRQIELQNYFTELLSIDKILNLPPMQRFLPIQAQKQMKISVQIERYSVYEDVVIYYLRFKNKETNEEWVYKQRYSELKNLHEALMNEGLKNVLPQFPARKFFGMTNENPGIAIIQLLEKIEKRREDLEIYLNGVFNCQQVYDNEVVQFLIRDSQKDYEKGKLLEQMKRNSLQKGDLNQKMKEISQKNDQQLLQQ